MGEEAAGRIVVGVPPDPRATAGYRNRENPQSQALGTWAGTHTRDDECNKKREGIEAVPCVMTEERIAVPTIHDLGFDWDASP